MTNGPRLTRISTLAVPAKGSIPVMRTCLLGWADCLSSRSLLLTVLCALVLCCFGSGTAQAGFQLSLSDDSPSNSSASAPADDAMPSAPPSLEVPRPLQDANTNGAGGGSAGSSVPTSGLSALPGFSSEIHQPEVGSWLFLSAELDTPQPIPSSIFHPPRA